MNDQHSNDRLDPQELLELAREINDVLAHKLVAIATAARGLQAEFRDGDEPTSIGDLLGTIEDEALRAHRLAKLLDSRFGAGVGQPTGLSPSGLEVLLRGS